MTPIFVRVMETPEWLESTPRNLIATGQATGLGTGQNDLALEACSRLGPVVQSEQKAFLPDAPTILGFENARQVRLSNQNLPDSTRLRNIFHPQKEGGAGGRSAGVLAGLVNEWAILNPVFSVSVLQFGFPIAKVPFCFNVIKVALASILDRLEYWQDGLFWVCSAQHSRKIPPFGDLSGANHSSHYVVDNWKVPSHVAVGQK